MKSLQPHQKHHCFSCVWEDLLLIPSFLFLFPDDCEPIKFLFARQCEHARGWFRCLLTRLFVYFFAEWVHFVLATDGFKVGVHACFALTFSFVIVFIAVNHRVSKVIDTGSEGDRLFSPASLRRLLCFEWCSAAQSRCFHELNICRRWSGVLGWGFDCRAIIQLAPQSDVATWKCCKHCGRRAILRLPVTEHRRVANGGETLSSFNRDVLRARPRELQKEIALACSSSPVRN